MTVYLDEDSVLAELLLDQDDLNKEAVRIISKKSNRTLSARLRLPS
jgi:hypothetical protein